MPEILFCTVPPLSHLRDAEIQAAIDQKTKPLGSLGSLETLALQIARIQQTSTPVLSKPHICVFAADHGLAQEGVSAYPSDVTAQMVINFFHGGAGINVFAAQHGIALTIVDAGVNAEFRAHPHFINAKTQRGSRNMLRESAMSHEDCAAAVRRGREIVRGIHAEGCNVIGFGEMGIGNTSAAALLMHSITQIPLEDCIGKGTGLSDAQMQHKVHILQQVVKRHTITTSEQSSPMSILQTFGGFEIAMMCGAMLEAAHLHMILLIDGFIASSALLVAHAACPQILEYCIFSHESDEQGHKKMLAYLGATPLLRLGLRLGEGTGCALAYPLVVSAVAFLNSMATFSSAGVSTKTV
ncbi:MAG: nicotinate-nucleotide--dimethylbenzimidazole phosphoribosyltransferase [Candidatus Kapaibacterium sp.]|nr:MAG: nicotinate-nucleotide--dimethylbenzimidazole phosphoribosyltransferase [Candidatus Kapabacteria bacterium]